MSSKYRLCYPDKEPKDRYSLLELTPDLVKTTEAELAQGYEPTLYFSAANSNESEAYLCTMESTFALRLTKSSNTMLLCNIQQQPQHPNTNTMEIDQQEPENEGYAADVVVIDSLQSVIDASRTQPKLDPLRQLMKKHYLDQNATNTTASGGASHQDIQNAFQGSQVELDRVLKQERIACVEGYYYSLTQTLVSQVLKHMLLIFMSSETSDTTGFDKENIVNELLTEFELSPNISRPIIDWFSNSIPKSTLYELDIHTIASEIGQSILAQQKSYMINSFMTLWRKEMGDAYEHFCKLELLKGHSLYDESQQSLQYISKSSLPQAPLNRFNYLFSIRPKWKPQDMEPFLDGVGNDMKEREKWILKAVRKIKDQDGQVLWTSRLSA